MQDPSPFTQLISPSVSLSFPEQEQLKCPRCDSTNTKFCYYNNYNLSQPRHFCKSCRRYWTKGGALRNIPVGGGTRKTAKRSSSKRPAQDPKPDPNPLPKSDPTPLDQINGGSFSSLFGSYPGPPTGSGQSLNPGSGSELRGSGGLQNGWPDLAFYAAASSSSSSGSRFHSSVNQSV